MRRQEGDGEGLGVPIGPASLERAQGLFGGDQQERDPAQSHRSLEMEAPAGGLQTPPRPEDDVMSSVAIGRFICQSELTNGVQARAGHAQSWPLPELQFNSKRPLPELLRFQLLRFLHP